MSLLGRFVRVDGRRPCPVCGKRDWCLLERENPDSPARVICSRVESPRRWRSAGWLHVPRDEPRTRRWTHTTSITVSSSSSLIAELAQRYRDAADEVALDRIGRILHLDPPSLRAFDVGIVNSDELQALGYGFATLAMSFPMRDAARKVVGVRLRFGSGRKLSVRGSKNGLFFASPMLATGPLLFAEGETDAIALTDLGFDAIGRPSCSAAVDLACRVARSSGVRDAVVVADADQPGRDGALRLARALRLRVPSVRIIEPPEGIKDARAWKVAGATHDDVVAQIEAAVPVELVFATKGGR